MYYISLNESFNPSALEPGVEYPDMFISWFNLDLVNQSIKMGLDFGNVVSGVEEKGAHSQIMVRKMSGSEWLEFVSLTSSGTGEVYVEKQQQYLLDKLVEDDTVDGVVEYQEFQL